MFRYVPGGAVHSSSCAAQQFRCSFEAHLAACAPRTQSPLPRCAPGMRAAPPPCPCPRQTPLAGLALPPLLLLLRGLVLAHPDPAGRQAGRAQAPPLPPPWGWRQRRRHPWVTLPPPLTSALLQDAQRGQAVRRQHQGFGGAMPNPHKAPQQTPLSVTLPNPPESPLPEARAAAAARSSALCTARRSLETKEPAGLWYTLARLPSSPSSSRSSPGSTASSAPLMVGFSASTTSLAASAGRQAGHGRTRQQ